MNHEDDPLVKAGGIKALLSDYLKHNKAVYKKFKKSVEATEVTKPSKKRLRSQSNASDASELPKKRQRTSSNASESSQKKKKAKAVLPPAETIVPVLFQRIDPSKFVGKIQSNLVDCTFEAKARFGQGGDSYGSWSSEKLIHTRGESFTKMKNKMKNRNTHASGTFNASAVNSVKFWIN